MITDAQREHLENLERALEKSAKRVDDATADLRHAKDSHARFQHALDEYKVALNLNQQELPGWQDTKPDEESGPSTS